MRTWLIGIACSLVALAAPRRTRADEPAPSVLATQGEEAPAAPRERRRARSAKREADGSAPSVGTRGRERSKRAERPPRKKTAYDLLKETWHAPASDAMCAEVRTAPVPDLVFLVQGKDLSYVLRPRSRQGGFDESQLALAKEAFGSWDGGPTPHPRTLDLVYAAVLHFEVPYVHLISGVRRDRNASRHSHGLAADVVLPGVDDEELAAFFRAQGFVGVGTYPRSGFVHVDTRDKSYFWIDYSSPGRKGKITQVRAEEAKLVDEAAMVRGHDGFVNPPRLQKALNARAVKRRHRGRQATQATTLGAAAGGGAEP